MIRLLRFCFRPLVLLLALAGGAYWWWQPDVRAWLPDLSQSPEYRLRVADIQVTPPPQWVPPDLVTQVVHRANLPEELCVLDAHVARDVGEAFALHPWVEQVVAVRKSVPARIEVELRYRAPVAMVQMAQGMYPIDARGVLLPPADFRVVDTKNYPEILNIRSSPGPAGMPWGDSAVQGAAELAAALLPWWKSLDIKSIAYEASTTGATSDDMFVLLTARGSRILWGRAPSTDHPGELSVEQKIGRMREYVTRFGGFDRPNGPYEFDIRHWREISRRPLTARHAPQSVIRR